MNNLNLKECLREICNVIGDTNSGYTGSRIDKMMIDIDNQYNFNQDKGQTFNNGMYTLGKNKSDRIYNFALFLVNKHGEIKTIKTLCEYYLKPLKWINEKEKQQLKFVEINKILNLTGFEITSEMKMISIEKVNTIKEVEAKWNSLYSEIKEYNQKGIINNEIIRYCEEESKENFFYHAIDQICKHLEEKIKKQLTTNHEKDLDKNATNLLIEKLTIEKKERPYFITQKYTSNSNISKTSTEDYQNGYILYIRGLLKLARNVFAHSSKITLGDITKEETISLLITLSRAYDFIDSLSKIRE